MKSNCNCVGCEFAMFDAWQWFQYGYDTGIEEIGEGHIDFFVLDKSGNRVV